MNTMSNYARKSRPLKNMKMRSVPHNAVMQIDSPPVMKQARYKT